MILVWAIAETAFKVTAVTTVQGVNAGSFLVNFIAIVAGITSVRGCLKLRSLRHTPRGWDRMNRGASLLFQDDLYASVSNCLGFWFQGFKRLLGVLRVNGLQLIERKSIGQAICVTGAGLRNERRRQCFQ